jgi:malonate-semialdehyde dehydrogenase (acetylating)/methylmalonate-semialdehyde dehydrogenase
MTSTAVSPSTQVRVLANHVGGAWTPSSATDTLDDRDPATGALLARVPLSPEARERLVADIGQAEADGARVVLDGRGDAGPAGCSLAPTILDAVPAGHRVVQEELFGPVLTLVRASDLDAAIDLVNGSRYGNASVIFTESGGAARAYRYGVEAGMVNVGVAAPVAWFPFSGWKDSIDGDLHANGRDAADFYTRKKVVTSRWA